MNLIDGAPFGPETVKAIGEVFDQASARINRIFANDPNAAEAASVRLAEAILSVATEGNTFVEDLKNRVNRGAGQDNRPERDAGVTAAGKLLTAFEQSPFLVGFTPRQRLDLAPIPALAGQPRCVLVARCILWRCALIAAQRQGWGPWSRRRPILKAAFCYSVCGDTCYRGHVSNLGGDLNGFFARWRSDRGRAWGSRPVVDNPDPRWSSME